MSVFVVAECGVNWRTIAEAKKMLEVFKECGADACKFQYYEASHVMKHPRAAELTKIAMTPEIVKELMEYGHSCDIEVFWTPMFVEAVDVLEKAGVNTYKVRSTDATNTSLLRKVLSTKKEVFISVASDRLDWGALDDQDSRYRAKLLYCIQRYPAPDSEVHLKSAFPAMRSYISSVEYAGLSDHTVGITCPVAAVAMGAGIIEKHVMLDNQTDWIDKPVSITPMEFKEMVRHIRRVEVMR
ncbi:MAG: N-acetylneuraminate synthase family protein [Candidatus Paceibacterota bacterium]|jgi:sialic acid synthase SpsE